VNAIPYVIGAIVALWRNGGCIRAQPNSLKTVCWLSVVFGVSGGITLQAQSTCPSPPEYELLRQDEDYSYLRDPACKHREDGSAKQTEYDIFTRGARVAGATLPRLRRKGHSDCSDEQHPSEEQRQSFTARAHDCSRAAEFET